MTQTYSAVDPSPIARARALLGRLVGRREQCAQLRRVPDETIRDLEEAYLFRLFQPRRYGGYEADPIDFLEIQSELSAACPSTGWTWGLLSSHAFQMSLFPLQAQEDVWASKEGALIASSYAPVGKRVIAVSGGYLLTGRWDFCSGIDHATWCFLGGIVRGDRPEFRTFLVTRDDYAIEDHWHVSGLQGTGSKAVIVDDAFVPEHRTHRMSDAFQTRSPGNSVNTSLLYKLPFGQVFVRSISTPVLGMAIGALDTYVTLMKSKVSTVSGARAMDDPRVLEALARGKSEIEMLKLKMRADFNEMWKYVRLEREIPLERRVQFKFESADVVRRCCGLIDELVASAGAKAIFRPNLLSLYHADALAARAHFGNNAPFFAQNYGGMLLGRELYDTFL